MMGIESLKEEIRRGSHNAVLKYLDLFVEGGYDRNKLTFIPSKYSQEGYGLTLLHDMGYWATRGKGECIVKSGLGWNVFDRRILLGVELKEQVPFWEEVV